MRAVLAHFRAGGLTSAGGHLAIIVLALFGLPLVFTSPPVTSTVIPVDVVRLDDVTRPPPAATPEPEPETTRAATPQPPPRPPQPVPEPPKLPDVKPIARAEPVPPPPVVPLPPKEKAPEPKPEPPVAKPEPPKPTPQIAKATPKAKPKPPAPRRDFDSILKDLSAEETPRKAPVPDRGEEAPQQSQVSELASIRELDRLGNLIRSQISPCWSPPPGARDADTLQVSLEISVDPTGKILQVSVVDDTRMALDSYFRSAAESARRAVLKCAPLELPADQYEIWKEIKFNFDPSKMLS
jgi:hypothetical protein